MARYVTLKDSDGEALYPQIKADSIADGSVTSDKIDWATMIEVLNVGTETTTANGNITLSIKKTEAIPLVAVTDATNAVPTFYTWSGQDYWVLHLVQVSSSAPVASSSITGIKVYYLKLS